MRVPESKRTVKILLYNIRYCLGTGIGFHLPFPFSGYFRKNARHYELISNFIEEVQPDIAGLIEVDIGSYRADHSNHALRFSERLRLHPRYAKKYGRSSRIGRLPVFAHQGNAVLVRDAEHHCEYHYFSVGTKRLIIKLEVRGVVFFLVHLSLRKHCREVQLRELANLVIRSKHPTIVAGDFNTFGGHAELNEFLAITGMKSGNLDGLASFPSRRPRKQLDFVLHSPEMQCVDFHLRHVKYSDHVPLVCELRVHK